MTSNYIGETLKKLIRENGMTQREFAKMLFVTEATMSNYINNKTSPPYETCVYISVIFGVTVDYLLGRGSISGDLVELNSEEYMLIEIFRNSDSCARKDLIRWLVHLRNKNNKKDN